MFPIIFVSEMEIFFDTLIFGSASWLFLTFFIGTLFLICYKVPLFSIFAFVISLFQMIAYIDYYSALTWTNSAIYKVILYMIAMIFFLYIFAGAVHNK
jgi:uncharacterized membrane protein YqhA